MNFEELNSQEFTPKDFRKFNSLKRSCNFSQSIAATQLVGGLNSHQKGVEGTKGELKPSTLLTHFSSTCICDSLDFVYTVSIIDKPHSFLVAVQPKIKKT